MEKDKHFEREKEYINLKIKLDSLFDRQRDLGYMELEKPIFKGYKAFLIPRDDIARRDDAEIFHKIASYSDVISARTINDFPWNKKSKKLKKRKYEYYYNKKVLVIKNLTEKEYQSLSDKVKPFFKLDTSVYGYGWRNKYYCILPMFHFQIKYEKEYITKIKIEDPLIEQEMSEIKSILTTKYYNEYYSYDYRTKFERKQENKRKRLENKKEIKDLISNNFE